ncbi:MAG: hypothetical protein IPI82_05775 [Candidatus Microthrix sp.]|nr:hypothetical protein [Candidatus Microthrix sp.]MBK7321956.1 hypothetical protein [Candidatus Microthrix sp.]
MRLQLALDVTDLDAAIGFYGRMFDAEPARGSAGLRQLRHRVPVAQAGAVRGR